MDYLVVRLREDNGTGDRHQADTGTRAAAGGR